jgi:toxin ParE1/3/4
VAEVLRTPRAKLDLLDIWLYIAEHNAPAADRLLEKMDEKCNMLAKWPEMGERREDLAPGLRFFSVGRYVILYRPIDEGIQLVRVLSGARDIAALFETDD